MLSRCLQISELIQAAALASVWTFSTTSQLCVLPARSLTNMHKDSLPTANLLFISPHLKFTCAFRPLSLEKWRRVWVYSRKLNLHELTHHLHIWHHLLAWCQKMSQKEFMSLFWCNRTFTGCYFSFCVQNNQRAWKMQDILLPTGLQIFLKCHSVLKAGDVKITPSYSAHLFFVHIQSWSHICCLQKQNLSLAVFFFF